MEQILRFAKRATLPGCVVAFALVVRVLFAQEFLSSPLAQPFEGGHDRALYHQAAQGPLWPDGAFEHLPLYPFALRILYGITGVHLSAAAGFGIACDALTTALIFFAALRLGARRWTSAAAALIFALYPLAIVYACLTMPNTLNTLLVAAFLCCASILKPGKPLAWAALGLLAGVAALGWAAWLMIVPALLGWWYWTHSAERPRRSDAAAFALAFLLPLVPVAWHNSRAEGSFVLLTTHGGFNFYMGNHERATGHPVRVRDFRMTARDLLDDAHRAAEQESGRTLTRSESSAWWNAQARRFWREQPGAATRLMLRKLLLFWNHVDMDDLRMVEQSRLLTGWFNRDGWPSFGLIGFVGLLGLVLARGAGVARVVTVAGMAGIVLYFITARYRLALAPALLVLGALGTTEFIGAWTTRRHRARYAGLALAIALLVFWPIPQRDVRAIDYYNAALQLQQAGRIAESRELATRGLAIDSTSAPLHHARGTALFKEANYEAAARDFAACVERDPAHPQAAYNLALSLTRAGRPCEARDALRAIAALRPLAPREQRMIEELARACDTGTTP